MCGEGWWAGVWFLFWKFSPWVGGLFLGEIVFDTEKFNLLSNNMSSTLLMPHLPRHEKKWSKIFCAWNQIPLNYITKRMLENITFWLRVTRHSEKDAFFTIIQGFSMQHRHTTTGTGSPSERWVPRKWTRGTAETEEGRVGGVRWSCIEKPCIVIFIIFRYTSVLKCLDLPIPLPLSPPPLQKKALNYFKALQ